jgi:hypothetical protein
MPVQTEQRYKQLAAMGLNVKLVTVGAKGIQYFKRRPQYNIQSEFAGPWPQLHAFAGRIERVVTERCGAASSACSRF